MGSEILTEDEERTFIFFHEFYVFLRHFSEQYTTDSQLFFHFFLMLNGLWQMGQIFDSRYCQRSNTLVILFFPHISHPLDHTMESEHEEKPHRMSLHDANTKYENPCCNDHEPSCRDRSEESDDPETKEKNRENHPDPERKWYDLLVVRMDLYTIKYLTYFLSIGFLWFWHEGDYREKSPEEQRIFIF